MSNLTAAEKSAIVEHAFQSAKDGIVGVDGYGLITHFNPAAVRLFRVVGTAAIGRHVDTLVIEASRDGFRGVVNRFIEKSDKPVPPSTIEVTALRGDGTSIRCEAHFAGLAIQDNRFLSVFFRDVTERKKASQKLYDAQKMEILDKFASDVAHEINNLLVGIQGHATLIRMADTSDERMRSASEIERLVKKGADVIKELRAFARGGGAPAAAAKAAVDLNAVVRTIHQFVVRTFSRKISVSLKSAQELPPVMASAESIEQALMAVCLNAQDAMPEGGELTIETADLTPDEGFVSTHPGMPRGRTVSISVRDTGHGMPDSVLRRAFEPFYTTREAKGRTGLGLTMAYRTMKDHGGYVSIESEPAVGTTVQLYFPTTAKSAALATAPARSAEIVRGTGTILVVDDDTAVLETATRMLKRIGYTVYSAKDGDEGLKIFDVRRDEIDLVIVDMKMPGKTGLETFQEMKKIVPEVKAILTTGFSIRGDTDAMFRLGLKALLLKPYTLEEMSATVDRVIKQRSESASSG